MDKIGLKGLVLALALTASSTYAQKKSTYQKKYVKVLIQQNWTADSLNVTKKNLKKQYNIDFNYDNVEFYKNGTIKSIYLSVNSNDGYSGAAGATGSILLKKGVNFGFYRNYKKFTFNHFGVGFLEK